MRMRLESGYDDAARAEEREQQRKTVEQAAKDFLGKVDVLQKGGRPGVSLEQLDEKKSSCGVLIDRNASIRSIHCARCSASHYPTWYRLPVGVPCPP
ncbi:hypothetical protein [uncultured Paludibaculum sp.]|uniref:hypothetical protein n=1 Tax=uncultured Paludibaculum sp. TaxID=1765020 RepID=UPI002AAB99DA|nr:hypothetical protein [uncultured Paludibaculum sp.]